MSTYVIVDLHNLAHRVRHGTRAPDIDSLIGIGLHVVFNSIRKVWTDFDADHVVFCLEGRSWRRDYYTPYKANRRELAQQRTQEQIDEDKAFFGSLDELIQWLSTKSNATVLRHPQAEADDMIARWISLHPDDQHVIVSTDSDFQQLLAPNVKIYNGISALLYTIDGVWDQKGQPARNKKGEPMATPDPEWLLFEKILRGDDGDNVMSAYPGVRRKRLQEAFLNRHDRGYAWNNLMLSTWVDHNGQEIRVRDAYQRNQILIDLQAQPAELKDAFDETIAVAVNQPHKSQVGTSLMKFANRWGLVRIENHASDYSQCFSAGYDGPLRVK